MTASLIGLGSNLDNPAAQLQMAVDRLRQTPELSVKAVSGLYRTPPMGPSDQPDFLNAVALAETQLTADQLLAALQAIETDMGRIRRRHWGERCIDLDLLLHGNETLRTEHLTLPHPGVCERAFVLVPLCELLGEGYVMPDGSILGRLRAACADQPINRLPLTITFD